MSDRAAPARLRANETNKIGGKECKKNTNRLHLKRPKPRHAKGLRQRCYILAKHRTIYAGGICSERSPAAERRFRRRIFLLRRAPRTPRRPAQIRRNTRWRQSPKHPTCVSCATSPTPTL